VAMMSNGSRRGDNSFRIRTFSSGRNCWYYDHDIRCCRFPIIGMSRELQKMNGSNGPMSGNGVVVYGSSSH
jgi:hypothetical protein